MQHVARIAWSRSGARGLAWTFLNLKGFKSSGKPSSCSFFLSFNWSRATVLKRRKDRVCPRGRPRHPEVGTQGLKLTENTPDRTIRYRKALRSITFYSGAILTQLTCHTPRAAEFETELHNGDMATPQFSRDLKSLLFRSHLNGISSRAPCFNKCAAFFPHLQMVIGVN